MGTSTNLRGARLAYPFECGVGEVMWADFKITGRVGQQAEDFVQDPVQWRGQRCGHATANVPRQGTEGGALVVRDLHGMESTKLGHGNEQQGAGNELREGVTAVGAG